MAQIASLALKIFKILLSPFADNPDVYREFRVPELSNDNYMHVENALAVLRGVQHPNLDTTNGTVRVGFYSSHATEAEIIAALRAAGFTAKPLPSERSPLS